MRKSMKVSSVLLSVVLLSNMLVSNVYAEEEKPLVTQELETDQVIITFKEDVKSEEKELDVVSVKTLDTEEIATLKVPEGETVETYIEELEAREDIESAEPDHLVQLTYTPNDPYFNYFQYHHNNIETERAWDKTMGSSDVVVAVLDSGFDINHPDLANQIVSPHATSDSGFSIDDHGTHVAGIIGSSIDNNAYGAGVAPETSIMPIDVFVGDTAYTSDVIEGIYQAVWAGADIINMSLGSYYYNSQYDNAIQYAYQNGLVIVAAAGNDATTRTHYPSSYDNVISVGSTDSSNYQSYFSNYGYDIDIVAPGSSIYSTMPNFGFSGMSGTSMASPVVAGVAALVLANEPHLTNDELVNRLLTTTKDLGTFGKDYIYGNGLVNAKQALKIIDIPSPTVPRIYNYSTSVLGYLSFELENGKVLVRDQSGNIIGSEENYSGYTYFYVAIPQQSAGTKLYISVLDSYGNESEASEITVSDGIVPDKPIVHEVTDQSTTITGSAEADAMVSVYMNDYIFYTDWVDGNGNFEIPITPLTAGIKLSLNVKDEAGNISESTNIVVKDATAPAKPKVNEVTEDTVKVTGTAEAGSIIRVKSKNILLGEATAADNSSYSVAIAKQPAGTILSVSSTDTAGNSSETTKITVKDLVAPTAPEVNPVTDKMVELTGTAEADAAISVKVDGKLIGSAVSGADSKFSVAIPKQKGSTILTVTAIDRYGNISEATTTTVKDATAPTAPTVDKVTDKSMAVTGSGEVNALISIKAGTTELGRATVAPDGKYKVSIAAQKVGTKIQVAAIDAAGNTSVAKEITVTDGTAPSRPTVDSVTHKTINISGTAEADSTIVVQAGTKKLVQGKTASNGTFSLPIESQAAGTELTVIATDAAGNQSAATKTTVVKAAPETTDRISGSSRYMTAIAISEAGWDSAETVVLATAADFPDALAGGPLAYQEDAPILLTKTQTLTPETKQEIQRLGAKKVIVLGRSGAVSAEVEAELKRMNLTVERIGGKSRFETAALIAEKLDSDQAVVANGLNFPDVLSVSSYAAKNGVPILLTRTDRLPEETKAALENTTSTYVIGSAGAVSEGVFHTLPKPRRLGGKDRYETGYIVATTLLLGTDKAFIATGMNFPDALAGSVLAAKNDAPILLVRPEKIPDATNRQLAPYDGFSIFGGTGAVSDGVKSLLDEALKN